MHVNPAIQAAALQLAQAEAWGERTAEPLAAANEKYERIQARIADLDRQRADLIARRQRGEQHPDDAANMTLIDADREGLAVLLNEAGAAVVAARRPHEDAKREVEAARHQLQRTEDEATEKALTDHLHRLDTLMLEALQQLLETNRRIGTTRPTWGPSRPLRDELRRIQAALGTL